jgi:hypothetical protein
VSSPSAYTAFDHVGTLGTYVDLELRRQGIARRFSPRRSRRPGELRSSSRSSGPTIPPRSRRTSRAASRSSAGRTGTQINGVYIDEILIEQPRVERLEVQPLENQLKPQALLAACGPDAATRGQVSAAKTDGEALVVIAVDVLDKAEVDEMLAARAKKGGIDPRLERVQQLLMSGRFALVRARSCPRPRRRFLPESRSAAIPVAKKDPVAGRTRARPGRGSGGWPSRRTHLVERGGGRSAGRA